jgi:hypothetical protein
MKTTLHIGTTKTGSKSIQTFLSTNRSLLSQQGILFPESLGNINHFSATVYAGGSARNTDLATQLGVNSAQDYAAFCEALPKSLAAEIADHSPQHVVISNEHLHSRFRTEEEFVRLKQLLGTALDGREVQVIVYLRPQVEHVMSLYSTVLRGGHTETPDTFVESWMSRWNGPYFNYKSLIDLWANAFGRESLRVRSYASVKPMEHGVVSDFLSVMGIDATQDGIKLPHMAHMSMGARAADIILAMNRQDPKMPQPARRAILGWVRHDLRGGKIRSDPDVLRRFQALFHDGNQEVIENWMPDHPDAFTVNWEQFEKPADEPDISADMILRLIEKLNPAYRR